ncbi:MAG: DUF1802 family protein [Oscillatoriales cyanobacterium]|uniref:DUF1802 family protein n=1 Tax=Microcoleus sp. PH2017_05_CCC_O_A TaxID=2798816 RepID=UPI001D6B385A|nr:DUF1802 family protein [Microcoleus sp. PH2017_05_CCC_O_A]TAG00233.1 MAG: DUF1802 family protein [Oscillatoriales cyanobacterium]MCC3437749.1 DUF1802 family protein [Microcoleus sp. PH2017_05_CCC_O_A]TAG20495.1 MAG: DUF1802 family protein [Oscillatoriales cyanobacterium]TAG34072.1 MAG: DUF1802 family protein [Oscillatoriales cyanobacterium]TAG58576.1 MAG: DUF1802 family protein [Oscillatoriales cyanobacterium]
MSKSILLQTALALPNPDIEALIQGRMIVAMPRMFLNPGRTFALYPANLSVDLLSGDRHYRSHFLPIAQKALAQLNSDKVSIKAWAKCELCQMVNEPESLEALSRLTVWKTKALEQILQQRPFIFVAYLRVYLLPQPFEIPVQSSGNFVSLSKSLNVTDSTPVLSESIFAKRRQKLEKLELPEHPELEELQSALVHLSTTNPKAKQLDEEIKIFLGWSENLPTTKPDPDLDWIKTIAQIGNSSDGNTFEKLVRQSLVKLGFANSNTNPRASLNPESTGGAGGLDFYCETPYPVAGECKASKHESVPNSVTAQLIHLGLTHLGQDRFDRSVKIILAAGPLTNPANQAAIGSKMNVIRPETLQRLVELKAKQPGSIDLLQLKPCLEQQPFGEEADAKVNRYIDDVREKLKVRSHVLSILKKYLETTGSKRASVDSLSGAFSMSNPPKQLSREELHEILVELSSPLTGYAGRIKGDSLGRDRFYFLRDLLLDD